MRFGKIRAQRDGAVMARQRLLRAMELVERVALIGVRLGIIGLQRQRAFVAGQGIVVALEVVWAVPRLEWASTKFGRSASARS